MRRPRRRTNQEQVTENQKVLRQLMIANDVRANVCSAGIAAVLTRDGGLGLEEIAVIRDCLTELEDITAAAEKARRDYYAADDEDDERERRE